MRTWLLDVYFSRPLTLVKKYGAVVECVNYRLSGEAPYPATLEDCHSALCWMKGHAAKLGISDSQLIVGGESAGGGVDAGVDVYPDWFHAYDMFFPFRAKAKKAIARFEERFCCAAKHYFAPPEKE